MIRTWTTLAATLAWMAVTTTVLKPDHALAQIPPTPNEDDIPKPVPVEIGLAGDRYPDISRFLNVRTATAPSLSPDGRKLAFRTQISGAPQLWVVDATGGWPRQLTFGEPVTFHAWSPAGDWIIYGVDRGGDEREGFYLISPDGTRERELLPPSDAFRVFGDFTRDGRRIVYATTERNGVDFDIHLLDIETGEDREIFRGRMGLYAAAWRPDGGAVLLTEARGEDANDVYLYDVATGRLDTLFSPPDRASYDSFQWTPDGSGFYLATNQEGEYAALAYYDVARRELFILEAPDSDVEDVALSADGRFIAWTTNEGGYSALHVRDLGPGGGAPTPERWRAARHVPVPELPRGVYSVTWASDAPVAAITVASPRVPGDIWTWNAETGETHRATHSDGAGLDLETMILPEHHSFPARDGVMLHGLLYMPDGLPSGVRPPVLLSVHGGPTAQARPVFEPTRQYLLTRGIAVFELNYRGSTGYGKTFARLNDGRLREAELYDLEDAVRWLASTGRVDASRVALMGASYGGYLTMAGLARLPHLWRAGVAAVGVSNWITALEGASPQLKASDRIEYGDIDDPADREFFRSISPITHVANVRAPVMVIHGANDPRDPVEESDRFVRAIRERGGVVEYLRFPDEGHGVRKLSNRIIQGRRIARFLEQHLEVRAAR
jgi:dipeptidyl aminopeptidase/acylaminoacyl peptidase|nr:MAG: peptidase S9 [bacterium]